ncbi:hypothetical protein LCGC14_1177210 [marine sediment metagenome]|uniref:Uncharacterized protein n=1 Tax=marine sediment metagenome TaxID=412755 RepID=A0A0F9P651_9ZZZZ
MSGAAMTFLWAVLAAASTSTIVGLTARWARRSHRSFAWVLASLLLALCVVLPWYIPLATPIQGLQWSPVVRQKCSWELRR